MNHTANQGIQTVVESVAAKHVSRRRVVKAGFWASVGAVMVAAGASVVNTLYPRALQRAAGSVKIAGKDVPPPGRSPVRSTEGRFVLVNLIPGEGNSESADQSGEGGLLALREKCPHLGCTVPWEPDFRFGDDERRG